MPLPVSIRKSLFAVRWIFCHLVSFFKPCLDPSNNFSFFLLTFSSLVFLDQSVRWPSAGTSSSVEDRTGCFDAEENAAAV